MNVLQDSWSPIHNICSLLVSIQVCFHDLQERDGLIADRGLAIWHVAF